MTNIADIVVGYRNDNEIAIIDLYDPDNPKEITFAELNAGCDAVANGLISAGLRPGDRVGILSLNRVEFLEVMYGAIRAGCIPVPMNIKLPEKMMHFTVEDSGAKIVFFDSKFEHLLPESTWRISFENGYSDFIKPGKIKSFQPTSDDISFHVYTSGSTGRPKGVLLTHEGQKWQIEQLVSSRDMTTNDRSIVAAPLYHKAAITASKIALASGSMVVLLPKFNTKEYIKAIGKYKITILNGVPTMYSLILQQEDLLFDTILSSVRALNVGAGPAHEDLLKRLDAIFYNGVVNVNYALTEGGTNPVGWKHPKGLKRPLTCVGYTLPGCEMKLVDGPNENQGTLYLRNPGMVKRFHNLPEETDNRIKDGWLNTNDVLRRDEDGWYYFVGRADDMFVCAGHNIYPTGVEAMLENHPAINQAIVVPASHELKGEVPYAYVVLRPGAKVTESEIKKYTLENGPVYAYTRRVFFLDEIPLTGVKKVDREELKRRSAENG